MRRARPGRGGTSSRSRAGPGVGTRARAGASPAQRPPERAVGARARRAWSAARTRRDSRSSGRAGLGLCRQLARREADAAALAHGVEQAQVEAVPALRGPRIEAVRVPEHREAAAVLGRPVEEREQTAPRPRARRDRGTAPRRASRPSTASGISTRSSGRSAATSHGRKGCAIPARKPGASGKPERRVVAEAEPGKRGEVRVRVDAEVVVALAADLRAEVRERRHLVREQSRDPGPPGSCRGARPRRRCSRIVSTRRGRRRSYTSGEAPSWRSRVAGEEEERRRGARGSARRRELPRSASSGRSRAAGGAASRRAPAPRGAPPSRDPREDVRLQARSGPAHAEPCPAPGHVDVVRQGDREARTAPAGRLEPEAAPEPLDRRIEGVEARRRGRRSARARRAGRRAPRCGRGGRTPPPARRRRAARLAPPAPTRRGVVGEVVGRARARGHRSCPAPSGRGASTLARYQRTRLRTTRAAYTAAGRRSSSANTAST